MASSLSRRQLLQGAAASAFPLVLPSTAFASSKRRAPSDRIALGFIGVGGQGNYLLDVFLKKKEVDVLAVADVYEHNRNLAKKKVGENCAGYSDYRTLLDRKDIDAVVIATTDHWHALTSIHACEAGKDVYCEKPLTLTISEGRPLVNAARRYGRVFQVGSMQRSDDKFRYAAEVIRNGKLGKLLRIETGLPGAPSGGDATVIPPPAGLDWSFYVGPAPNTPYQKDRFGFNFRWFFDYGGGMMTDWGAHHNDIAQWALGMDDSGPTKIEGTGVFPTIGLYETPTEFDVTFTYGNGAIVHCKSGSRGVRFECEKGWIFVDRGTLQSSDPALLQIPFTSSDTRLYVSDDHRQNFLDCIKSRRRPIADVEVGHRSATMCHLGNIAVRTGRKITWDPKTETFGDKEMSRWLGRPYRAPWSLPHV